MYIQSIFRAVNSLIHVVLVFGMVLAPVSGYSKTNSRSNQDYLLKGSEPGSKSGSVYYTSHKKDEVLVKTNIWGAVQFPGVHYIPLETRFLDAVSIAGGPLDSADTRNIVLSTRGAQEGKSGVRQISLETALVNPEMNPILMADDIIIVKEDKAYKDTNLWLSIGTFVLSVGAFGLLLSNNNK